jgi:predicted GTPase
VVAVLASAGLRPVVVRHPMPYGDLLAERVQRFASLEDLDDAGVTVEEREEYEHHISEGTVVYAGVDYAAILEQAQAEADVVLWDGGNNDLPFYRPDLHIVVADPLRAGHETRYHPGETNLRMADVVVINKVDSASPTDIERVEGAARMVNPAAVIVRAESHIDVDHPDVIRGRRVLVIEDGPTLTHGEMKLGAGVVAARRLGAEVVDPRPSATGTLKEAFERYDVGPVLPALGYAPMQLAEMEQTIAAMDVDAVVVATPIDLRHLITLDKPAVRVTYSLREVVGPTIKQVLAPLVEKVRG